MLLGLISAIVDIFLAAAMLFSVVVVAAMLRSDWREGHRGWVIAIIAITIVVTWAIWIVDPTGYERLPS